MTHVGAPPRPLAVFDFGKTNTKMFVFAPDLRVLYEERCVPRWIDVGTHRALDHEYLWSWMQAALRRGLRETSFDGVMITTHGCTGALIGANGLVRPIIDYESESPGYIDDAFSAVVPDYLQTYSPPLPAFLNLGKQLFWIERSDPGALQDAEAIVAYPQYWCWMLGAPPLSEVTSLGSHTHLWSPARKDFSSLVQSRGWRPKFPQLERAGTVVGAFELEGKKLRVHNGVHDSNASLYLYRLVAGYDDCTLVSTGTWVVAFNSACPEAALDAGRDMLANVDVDGNPIPSARFMGGREYDILAKDARTPVTLDMIERIIRRAQFALPSFSPGGPFPGAAGQFVGPPVDSDSDRVAIATLYLACMTSTVLDLLHSAGPIVIDGGIAANEGFVGILASLRSTQRLLCSTSSEGTAGGAAAMAYAALGHRVPAPECANVKPWHVAGLPAYYDRWRLLANSSWDAAHHRRRLPGKPGLPDGRAG